MKLLGDLEPHTNWGSVGRPANALFGSGLLLWDLLTLTTVRPQQSYLLGAVL